MLINCRKDITQKICKISRDLFYFFNIENYFTFSAGSKYKLSLMVLITGHVLSVELRVKSMQQKRCSRRGYDFYCFKCKFFLPWNQVRSEFGKIIFEDFNQSSLLRM